MCQNVYLCVLSQSMRQHQLTGDTWLPATFRSCKQYSVCLVTVMQQHVGKANIFKERVATGTCRPCRPGCTACAVSIQLQSVLNKGACHRMAWLMRNRQRNRDRRFATQDLGTAHDNLDAAAAQMPV